MSQSLNIFKLIAVAATSFVLSISVSAQNQWPSLLNYDVQQLNGACVGAIVPSADYMVPMNKSKTNSAVFKMLDLQYHRCGNNIQVVYDLPLDLTGEKNIVLMTGEFQHVSNTIKIAGDLGSGLCAQSGAAELRCDVRFQKLKLNPEKAIQLVSEQNLSLVEFNRKKVAVGRFSGNPVGFFTIK
ncbi:MAG: hypothetical protein ACK5P5_07035 [Pseudobdellovibrionaceae bacterium]